MSAVSIKDTLFDVRYFCGKRISYATYLVGDKFFINERLARIAKLYFVRGIGGRFNIGVRSNFQLQKNILIKSRSIMVYRRGFKSHAMLCQLWNDFVCFF